MILILGRHGNTFKKDEKVVMAGLTNDIPLVAKGHEQAMAVAGWLRQEKLHPSAVYSSQLCRTEEYARVIMETLDIEGSPLQEKRLNELDYGDWTGLSDNEIIEEYGKRAFNKWQNQSIWPERGNWPGNEEEIIEETSSFLSTLLTTYSKDDIVVAITHGGRLRYFLSQIENIFQIARDEMDIQTWKVRTGHFCILQYDYDENSWEIFQWNANPATASSQQLVA